MKNFVDLLTLIIIILLCGYLFVILIIKFLKYKVKKLQIRDQKILLDEKWGNLTKKQLRVKEKELMKKITKYSLVEMIFLIGLIGTFWYCYVAIQNSDNVIPAIIIFILEGVILIVLWIKKYMLKREHYKCLTFMEQKIEGDLEIQEDD